MYHAHFIQGSKATGTDGPYGFVQLPFGEIDVECCVVQSHDVSPVRTCMQHKLVPEGNTTNNTPFHHMQWLCYGLTMLFMSYHRH